MKNKSQRFFQKALNHLPKLTPKQLLDLSRELINDRIQLIDSFDQLPLSVLLYKGDDLVYVNELTKQYQREIPLFASYLYEEGSFMTMDLQDKERVFEIRRVSIDGYLFIYVFELLYAQQMNSKKEKSTLSALEIMATGISHEIKNPLSAIDLHTQLLQNRIKKNKLEILPEVTNYIDIVQQETQRLLQILDHFLSMTRPHKPKTSFIEISTVIDSVYKLYIAECRSKKIDLKVILSPVPKIFTDTAVLQQIISDLLRNAIEAVEQTKNKVIQLCLHVSNDRNNILILVKDTGSGINPTLKQRIFEPYFSTKKTGTGLGLTLVKKMIRELNGQIFVENNNPTGTKFILSFPISLEQKQLI